MLNVDVMRAAFNRIKIYLLLSFLLYCFLVTCGILYFYYFNIPIASDQLKILVFRISCMILGLLFGILLYRRNISRHKYLFSVPSEATEKLYHNMLVGLDIYLKFGVFSMLLPFEWFYFIELAILDCILAVFHWIEQIIYMQFDVRIPLDKLLDPSCLRSAFLFLAVYFFCELRRVTKNNNT